jgi:palmitoyl-protein thioesterase
MAAMNLVLLLLLLPLLTAVTAATDSSSSNNNGICTNEFEWTDHPALCRILQRLHEDEEQVVTELQQFAAVAGLLVDVDLHRSSSSDSNRDTSVSTLRRQQRRAAAADVVALPVVLAHGMGDSCFNSGMQRVTTAVSEWLGGGVYTVCIPTGKSQSEDTKNGYFLNMDASVDIFAEAIQQIPELQGGFHAMGFSQGNNVIRGYIAKYNTPAVHTFLSVNGVNAGIGAVPYCRPEQRLQRSVKDIDNFSNSICDLLMEQASRTAYTEFAQQHSFQANYWRDPRPVAADLYHRYSQLAVWNNEIPGALNETLRQNWARTQSFVWVLALDDSMVWPAAGEHWGAPDPANPFEHILPMNETEWYIQDLFGLRTADAAGKNHFESFPGDHLQFTEEDLRRWVTTYFLPPPPLPTAG